MHIDHLNVLMSAEIEALVSEIEALKARVTTLESQVLHLETKNMSSFVEHEYIGHWNHKKIEDKTKVTCNTSELI